MTDDLSLLPSEAKFTTGMIHEMVPVEVPPAKRGRGKNKNPGKGVGNK